jgi:hypothetical protein
LANQGNRSAGLGPDSQGQHVVLTLDSCQHVASGEIIEDSHSLSLASPQVLLMFSAGLPLMLRRAEFCLPGHFHHSTQEQRGRSFTHTDGQCGKRPRHIVGTVILRQIDELSGKDCITCPHCLMNGLRRHRRMERRGTSLQFSHQIPLGIVGWP